MKKGNSSIEDYILKMKSLAMSLMAAGQQITDDELILYILGGLTSRESITLQEVQYILQTHEMRLESLNAITTVDLSGSSVHFVQRQSFRGGRGGRGLLVVEVDFLLVAEAIIPSTNLSVKSVEEWDT